MRSYFHSREGATLLIPAAMPPRCQFVFDGNDEGARHADQAKNGGGILRRIDAPNLGMQGQRGQE